ncbi:hypothetical protein [Pseudomonas farris]
MSRTWLRWRVRNHRPRLKCLVTFNQRLKKLVDNSPWVPFAQTYPQQVLLPKRHVDEPEDDGPTLEESPVLLPDLTTSMSDQFTSDLVTGLLIQLQPELLLASDLGGGR